MRIGIYFKSSTGYTFALANKIAAEFPNDKVTVRNITHCQDAAELSEYDILFLGSSTWDDHALQEDWKIANSSFDNIDFKGTKVALFETCDKRGWTYTFIDAIAIIFEKLVINGATIINHHNTISQGISHPISTKNKKHKSLINFGFNENITLNKIKLWSNAVKQELTTS